MAESFRLPWWFWRLQFQLLGGYRRVGAITLGYVALLGLGAWSWSRTGTTFAFIGGQLLNMMILIQSGMLGFGGCTSIFRAVLRDYQSKMFESHRMTAMTNMSLVIGYFGGATLQILALYLVNLIAGTVISYFAGAPIAQWVGGNLMLLSGSVTIWAMTIYAGVGLNKPINPVPGLFGIGILGFALALIPAAAVFSGIYSGILGVSLVLGRDVLAKLGISYLEDHVSFGLSAFQLLMTCFWLWAASRRYRRPDLPVFNAKGGLLLLLMWVVISLIGLRLMDEMLRGGNVFDERTVRSVPWIGTIIGALIISVIAIACAIETRAVIDRGRQPRDKLDRKSSVTVLLVSLVLAIGGLSLYLLYAWKEPQPTLIFGPWASRDAKRLLMSWLVHTAIPFALALISAQGIMTYFLLRPMPIKRLGGILILTLWTGPLVMDAMNMIYQAMSEVRHIQISWIWNCSPLGSISSAWQRDTGASPWVGLTVQAVVAVVAQIAGFRARCAWKPKLPAKQTAPAS